MSAEYIERMEDLLDLYERDLSDDEPVVCLDEKPIQILEHSRPPTRGSDGSKRVDYEYRRRGTANIFVCVEPRAGRHLTKVTPTRDHEQFAWMLVAISRAYPDAVRIHLVVDNLSTHSERSLIRVFGPIDGRRLWRRFDVHFTPKHGSWLNQAEIEISMLSRECLARERWANMSRLRRGVDAWSRRANTSRRTINWQFTTRDARKRLRYKSTNIKRAKD